MGKPLYLNRLQRQTYYASPRSLMFLAGRRFGKTTGVESIYAHRAQMSMPQGGGCFIGTSRAQLWMRTMPAMLSSWQALFGLREGYHFCWGRPPKALGYPDPFIRPKSYENELCFCNGWVWHCISMSVAGSANGLTSCCNVMDESKYADARKLKEEIEPTLSGIIDTFGRHGKAFTEWNPFYKSRCYVSDAPLSAKKNWMEKEAKRLDDPVDFGPHAGRTNRECQEELMEYARRVIYFDDLLYNAKKTGHKVMVVSEQRKAQIQAIAQLCHLRDGAYKILPKAGVNKQNVEMLVSYKIIRQEDAEHLFNYEYLITREEAFELEQYQHNQKYQDYIRELRCSTWGFVRASTLDNLDIVGEKYIAEMARSLPPLVFRTSILNLPLSLGGNGDGFYFALDIENLHGYVPGDCPALDNNFVKKTVSNVVAGREYHAEIERPDFEHLGEIEDCTKDGDVDYAAPLHIAIDTNAKICWLGVGQLREDWQRQGQESLYVINSLYTKDGERLHALCKKFNRYYRPKLGHCKDVHFYYDSTNKRAENYAIEGQIDFRNTIIQDLTDFGWNVIEHDMGVPPHHEVKYEEINKCLQGYDYPFIRINRLNNEELIIALENTGVQQGYKGFRKDKSGEKLDYNPDAEEGTGSSVPYELRTDVTDMFDNLVWGVKFHQYEVIGMSLPITI